MLTKITAFLTFAAVFICSLLGVDYPLTQNTESLYLENVSYGSHERHKLDLYIPENADGEVGLVLMIHGGAWVGGDKDGYRGLIKNWCEKRGYAAATMNYRYLSYDISFDDILDDIENAVKCIKEKGAENGVDINKMILSGHSAGGHLSMLFAYARKDVSAIEPVAVANYCGPTDLLDPNFHNENATPALKELYRQIASLVYGEELTLEQTYLANDLLRKASPLYYVDENTVPTIINHGMIDDTVPYTNALSLEAKFKELGVAHIMNPLPNSGHGLNNDPIPEAKADAYFYKYAEEYLK